MNRKYWAYGGLLLMASLGALNGVGGCSTKKDNPTETVSAAQERLTEQRQLSLSLPAGVDFRQIALGAKETLRLYDRAKIKTPQNGFGAVSNTGSILSNLGSQSQTGDLTSIAPVSLNTGARVEGAAKSSGTVTLSSGAVVTGSVTQNATLTPIVQHTWNVAFPVATDYVMVYPGQSTSLAPGAHGGVFVYQNAQLSLQSGTYYFDQLNIEELSSVSINTSGGPVFLYVRTALVWRGAVTGHKAQDLLVGYFGGLPIVIQTTFNGTLVAPSAPVRLGIGTPAHSGSVFAKTIELDPDTTFTFVPSGQWGTVFPPTPFVTCVRAIGGGTYEALFGYESRSTKRANYPVGPDNTFTNAPIGRGQPEVFLPHRIEGAFGARFSGASLTWTLAGQTATATPSSPACPANNCTDCGLGRTCLGNSCVSVCGDGLCSLTEVCDTCTADCGCAQGETCTSSGACGVPARCGIDWQCGSGLSLGVQVNCGACPAGKTCVAHACE